MKPINIHTPAFAAQFLAAAYACERAERKLATAHNVCEAAPRNLFTMRRLGIAQMAVKKADAEWQRLRAIVATSAALAEELERRTG